MLGDIKFNQVKKAKNWEKAYYDPEFREKLGLLAGKMRLPQSLQFCLKNQQ